MGVLSRNLGTEFNSVPKSELKPQQEAAANDLFIGCVATKGTPDEYKYTKEDICKLCEVSISSFEHFAPQSITERDFIVFGSSHKKLYREEVLKQFLIN